MRESRRSNLLLAAALLIVAAAFAAYAIIVLRWLTPSGVSSRPASTGPDVGAELRAARREFRARLLEPAAHLRLSEALWRVGRPVDSFYVSRAARELFGEEAFRKAHSEVVLGSGGPALTLRKRLDGARDPEVSIPLHAQLARDYPDAPEGRDSLAALSRLAAEDENAPGGEVARLARQALEELHQDDLKHPGKLSALGMSHLLRGNLGMAEAVAEEALSKNPKQAGAAQLLGAIALRQKDIAGAQHWLSAAWELNPDDLYSAAKLAHIYDRQRADPEAALPFHLALHRRDPDHSDGDVRAERRILETLDARRESLLRQAPVEALGPRFHSEDGSLRAEACARAAAFKDARWVAALGELLDDDVEIVRRNADYALFEIGKRAPELVRARREEWLSSDKPLLRIRSLNLFADLDGRNAFPAALAALHDPSAAVRVFAKLMVLDHYYKDMPEAEKARVRYLEGERDPAGRALLARFPGH